MNFQEQLEKFEQSQGTSTETLEQVSSAESVVAPVAEVPAGEAETLITPAAEVATPPAPTTPEAQQPDYNKFLEESSEGLFKTVDDFKQSLNKVKEYDDIVKQRDELDAKVKVDPFANDFVKQYNQMVKDGKSKDQINSFIKINELGDLSQLQPFDIKVERLVQDGWKREAAERKITRDFELNIEIEGEHLSSEEITANKLLKEDRLEELRISAQTDLTALESLKVKLVEPTDNTADNKALAQVAQLKEYNEKLQPLVAKIANEYTGIGSINVNGKEGAEAKTMAFEADPEYKKEAEQRLFEYFKDGNTPVNEQTVAEAKDYLDAVWISRNKEKFAQMNYNQGLADAKLATTNEFENKSGLPTSGLPPVTPNADAARKEQQRKAAVGEDN